MSIEAMAYVKAMDLRACEKHRFLVLIIAENTFNDTRICVVGNAQLAFETRCHERTVRRALNDLVEHRVLLRAARYPDAGGRLNDALRLRGFSRWYRDNYAAAKRVHKGRETSPGSAGEKGGLAGKVSGRASGHHVSGRATGQQVSGVTGQQVSGTEESRNYPVKSEEANFGLEGKGVRDRLRQMLGGPKFAAWLSDMAVERTGDLAVAVIPDKLKASWAERNFAEKILAACRAEWPDVRAVSIRTGGSP